MSFTCLALAAVAATGSDIIITVGLPDPALERSYGARVLSAEDLNTGPSRRLDEALGQEPGFQLFRRASSRVANPTTQGVTLRALGGNAASRISVVLDGVPQEDPFAGWIPFSAYTARDIATVRIVRGGGSVVAGPSALAGSLSMTSRLPTETGGQLVGSFGSFGTATLEGSLDLVGTGWFASASANAFESDGYGLIPARQRGAADVVAASRAQSFSLRVVAALGEVGTLSASLLHFTENKLGGFVNAPNRNAGLDASVRFLADGGTNGWSIDAALWRKERDFAAIAAAATPGRASAVQTLDQFDVPGTGWGGRLELRPPAFGAVSLRLGAEARFSSGRTNELFRNLGAGFTRRRLAGGESTILGGFGEVAWEASDAVLLSLGGRLDHWRLSNGVRQEFDRSIGNNVLDRQFAPLGQTLSTARAGGTWELTPAITLNGAAYLGWRPPTLNELYRPFRVGNDVTEANAQLGPEQLSGVDIGVAYAPLADTSVQVTLFANWLRGAVANVTVANGPGIFPDAGFIPAGGSFRQRQNLARVRSTGAEVRAQARLPFGLRSDIGYTFARAVITDAGTNIVLQNKRLAQSPLHQARAQLSWRDNADHLNVTAQLKYTSAVFEDDLNSRVLGAVTVLDVTARWRIFESTHIELGVENITNTLIVSALSLDGIITRANPRSVRVGLATRF